MRSCLIALTIAITLIPHQTLAEGAKEFSDKFLHAKAGIEIPGYDLTFKSDDADVKFQPNTRALFFLGATFQDYFGVSWGLPIPQNQEERDKKGETDYQDYRFNFAFQSFMVGLSYSKYKGFYVEDSKEVDSTWTPDKPYYNEPNLFSENAVANFSWVFSPDRFSLISVIEQTARQRESGGSFLAGVALTQTTFHNDQEIIPTDVRAQYGADKDIREGRFRGVTVTGGYGHVFQFSKKWFSSVLLQFGMGTQIWKIKGTNLNSSGRRSANKADVLLTTGYSGDDYFGGLSVGGGSSGYKTNSIEITSGLWSGKLFAGMRF